MDVQAGIGLSTVRGARAGSPVSWPIRWFQAANRPWIAYGLLATAALGYSLVALELSLAHARPMPAPYLRIEDADYFFWATFFYSPVIAGAWLVSSAAVYVMLWVQRIKSPFDRLLTAVALAVGTATLATLVPDLITSPLRALGVIDEQAWELSIANQGIWFFFTWTTLIAYVCLFVVAFPLAIRAVTSASWGRAIATGLAGFVVFQGFELVFIR
jgi:hypothetical protein